MAFIKDLQELKTGLVIFHRTDVQHRNWYCRVRLPTSDRYKTIALKTSDIETAKERAFDQATDVRFRLKHDVPIFNRPFSQIAADFVELTRQRFQAGEITQHRFRVYEATLGGAAAIRTSVLSGPGGKYHRRSKGG